jgi:cytosine/adenosine deaminase-related metal-dependent hydrolase
VQSRWIADDAATMKTLIEGGDIVAYHDGGHRLLRGGVLLLEDDRVALVGRRYAGPVDRRIDATGKLVIPGLVNIHCHATTEAGGRLIADNGAISSRTDSSTTTPRHRESRVSTRVPTGRSAAASRSWNCYATVARPSSRSVPPTIRW